VVRVVLQAYLLGMLLVHLQFPSLLSSHPGVDEGRAGSDAARTFPPVKTGTKARAVPPTSAVWRSCYWLR